MSISIHALREEGDCPLCIPAGPPCDFNPRPPRGGRLDAAEKLIVKPKFQSTPSARRATSQRQALQLLSGYFNPRPPRGGRLQCERPGKAGKKFQSTPSARRATVGWKEIVTKFIISIHALREEGDTFRCTFPFPDYRFQSTPSARRATINSLYILPLYLISIHALREEGDSASYQRDRRSK